MQEEKDTHKKQCLFKTLESSVFWTDGRFWAACLIWGTSCH